MKLIFKTWSWLVLFYACSILSGTAITLDELRKIPDLTPEKFASFFSHFEFKFHEEVQDPETFLATQSGDCDDYATLAADVLSKHGYTTRLIAVRMDGDTHVVCYIKETKSYLDYNYREENEKTILSGSSISEIAGKVAKSFEKNWIATYQFTFRRGIKRLVQSIIVNRSLEKAG
ncbi:MAG: transglutaminase-like domain-containing protein [Verrucomicrobiota bacterium]